MDDWQMKPFKANPAYTANGTNRTIDEHFIGSSSILSQSCPAPVDRQILTMAISTDKDGNTTTTNQPQSQPDNNVHDLKQQRQQTKPHEQTPKTETIRSLFLLGLSLIDTYVLPGATRTTIVGTVHAHPILATFLAAQFAVAFFPLLLFTLAVCTVGVVAAGLSACLGMVVLVPVLLVTGVLGVVVWGWGWGVFVVGRWAWGVYVEKRLGGEDGERPVVVKEEEMRAFGKKW